MGGDKCARIIILSSELNFFYYFVKLNPMAIVYCNVLRDFVLPIN